MARGRMINDTVVLYNYIGEVDDEATFQETVLEHCCCPLNEGADLNIQGKKANDSARLYIFDANTTAVSNSGTKRAYLPYAEWLKADDKDRYWTLSDKGTDYFKKVGSDTRLRIVGYSRKHTGSKRMWHFEVDGR